MSATITALMPHPSRPRMVVVEIDGRRAATLSQKTVERLGLTVGQCWVEGIAQQVAGEAHYEKYLSQAGRWLDRRMLSRSELQAKLAKAACPDGYAGRILDRMTELTLIDDRKLGQLLIDGQSAKQSAGPARLRAKLLARGIDESLADELIGAAVPSSAAAFEQALALAQQKLSGLAGLDPVTRKRRLGGLLERRGFDQQTVADVLERVLGIDEV